MGCALYEMAMNIFSELTHSSVRLDARYEFLKHLRKNKTNTYYWSDEALKPPNVFTEKLAAVQLINRWVGHWLSALWFTFQNSKTFWDHQAVTVQCFTTSAIQQNIFHNHVLYTPVLTNNFRFHQIRYSWENVLVLHLPKTFCWRVFFIYSLLSHCTNSIIVKHLQYMYKSYAEQRKKLLYA